MEKITGKEWMMATWPLYNIKSIENASEFLELLNILQSRDLSIEDMHNTVINGDSEFMRIWNYGGWKTMDDLYKAILEYNTFFTEDDFIEWILEMQEELKNEGYEDPVEEIRSWTDAENWLYKGHPVDTMIVKTEDGYVRQITY
jgi:hypothetical protein